jgi:hypothetical protein
MTALVVSSQSVRPVARTRLALLAASTYVLVRVLLVVPLPLGGHPDSASYRQAPSFIGSNARPWFVPLVYALTGSDRGFVLLQATVSASAFLALGVSIGRQMRNDQVRLAMYVAIPMIGLTTRLTFWDTFVLSESLGISLTLFLIAAAIQLKPGRWEWVFPLIFVLWLFTKDAHLYLGVLVVIAVTVWGVRHARYLAPLLCFVAAVWGFVASDRDSTIESYNVAANIAWHAPPGSANAAWFVDHGAPVVAGVTADQHILERVDQYLADDEFDRWARSDGPTVYAEFLITHPGFTLGGLTHFFVDGGIADEALVDHTSWPLPDRLVGLDLVWPNDASVLVPSMTLLAVVATAVQRARRRNDDRVVIPLLLLASAPLHALLAYHASPLEIARHGTVLSLVTLVSAVWLLALTVDQELHAVHAIAKPTGSRRHRRWGYPARSSEVAPRGGR